MVILHSDNGAAQRSFTLQAKLRYLGIEHSYSPPVSRTTTRLSRLCSERRGRR
jgi:transposase InsO family protein